MEIKIKYEFKRGDTVYFVMYDQLQETTVSMVLATIHGSELEDDGKVVYVLDREKIKFPERKKYARGINDFENIFSKGQLYSTPEQAINSLLNKKIDESN